MIFQMPKKEYIQILTLKIDNTNIDKVDEFNLLWLTIDTHLKWKNILTKFQISLEYNRHIK